ncbi:unnamed protein product [Schistosoma turkestanicum]|nr:unnamed protein product [Schistosoma turkestanicum]
MTQRIASHTTSEVPQGLCNSSMDASQITSFADAISNQGADICKIEHTQFGEIYVCKLCNVKCTGKAPFSQHIAGAHHRRSCNAQTFFCNDCNTNLNSPVQYTLHCGGSKHIRNTLYSSDNSMSEQSGLDQHFNKSDNVPYFRIPCGLKCSSKEQHQVSLSGQFEEYILNEKPIQQTNQPDFLSSIFTLFSLASNSSANPLISKMVPCLKNIIELESKLTLTNNLSPSVASLSPCSYQQQTNLNSSVLPNQQDKCDSPGLIQFCRHSECVLLRSLQFYESNLNTEVGNLG